MKGGELKKYLSFFRIRFSTSLQYRSAALAGMATQFAWGTMLILMFKAFYETDPGSVPMEFSQLTSYIWLQQAFLALFNFYAYDNEILESISSGSVACELLRPISLYNMWFIKSLATRAARTVLRCAPILAVSIFLPAPFGLSAPHSPLAFVLFLFSAVLGAFITCAFAMLIYSASFYTIDTLGLRILFMALADFLAGGVIPLPLFPNGIRQVAEFSPFGGAQNLALRIYTGNVQGSELWLMLGVQLSWVIIIIVLGSCFMRRAVRKTVIQGG